VTILQNLLSVSDGGLGVVSPGGRPIAVVGCCSSGTVATPVTCYTIEQLVAAGTAGPAVEDAAIILALSGGPVILCRAAQGTAAILGGFCQSGAGSGAAGTIAADGGNTSTAVLALTGTPDKRYSVKIKCTLAGANLAASPKIAISLDGGVSYLAEAVAVAGPTAIGSTGISVGITDGTFVLNDVWTATGASCPTDADATGTSVPAFSGTPLGSFDIIAKVTTAAASLSVLTAAVKFSLDGGRHYGAPVGIPASGVYAIPNTGVTVTFGAGSFVVGDTFQVKTAAPIFSTTTLDAALTGLAAISGDYEFVHVAGAIDATHAAILKAWGIARQTAGEDVFSLAGCRDQAHGETVAAWEALIGGATPGFAGYDFGRYGDVHSSHAYVDSALYPGSSFRRNGVVLRSARLALIPLQEHPGKVQTGPIAGIMPEGDEASVLHDGASLTPLDGYRFSTMQRLLGQPRDRYFFTSRTMALATSDFGEVQRIRVICRAATKARYAMSLYVGSDPEVKTDGSGQLTEGEAAAIEAEVTAYLKRELVDAPNGFATRVSVAVNRLTDVLATGTITATISVVPKGSINVVSTTVTYARS
jgi:hypothetical protein